jgi:hypothetical protein
VKKPHSTVLSLLTAPLLGLCLLTLVGMMPARVTAQTCTNPPQENSEAAWPVGGPSSPAAIHVNINPTGLTTAQQQAIAAAFTNWQNAPGNNSQITFNITFSTTPVSGTNTYQVNVTQPQNPSDQAETGGETNGSYRVSASTTINPGVTDPTALTQAMAHEIGHTFGLDDCTSCAAGTSVMTEATSLNDTTSGMNGPSACDAATANTVMHNQSPPAVYPDAGGGGGGGDSGGGHYGGLEGDGCTPYYWNYYNSYDGGETWEYDYSEYAGCW